MYLLVEICELSAEGLSSGCRHVRLPVGHEQPDAHLLRWGVAHRRRERHIPAPQLRPVAYRAHGLMHDTLIDAHKI
jgi:hypothetical protein